MSTKSSKVKCKEVELPSFSWTNPEFWLESVDSILSFEDNNEDQKYELVKQHLYKNGDKYLIENFLEESRREGYLGDMYTGFRTYILEQKKEMQFHNLASVESFTSRELKPSAFLQHVHCVMSEIPKSIKRLFWLSRLPRRIQRVLMVTIVKDPAPMEDRSLEDLAAFADGVAAYEKYHSWSTLPHGDSDRICLPTYDENDPELWFYSVDEAFSSNNVTDDAVKYESTFKALRDNDILTASLFMTELPNRTTSNQYDNLRERIIETYAVIKGDAIYRLLFRDRGGLKPSKFFNLLNDLAAKTGKAIPQLVVRTLWIMQLPIRAQSILFKAITASREPLQDLEMDALFLLADGSAHSDEGLNRLIGNLSKITLDDSDVDIDDLEKELETARTLEEKVAIGMRYCDFMYRVYYDHSPFESIRECTQFRESLEPRLDAEGYFARGCTCWYHETYGAEAVNCAQVQEDDDGASRIDYHSYAYPGLLEEIDLNSS